MASNENIKVFIIHITSFSLRLKTIIHFTKKTQITFLLINKIFKSIPAKYLKFIDIFLKNLVIKQLNNRI